MFYFADTNANRLRISFHQKMPVVSFPARTFKLFVHLLGQLVKLLHDVFFVAAGILFMVWLFLCTFFNGNILPILSILIVRPLSLSLHESLLCSIASLGWSTVIYYSILVGRFQPIFYGDLDKISTKYPGNKLLISNHVAMTDGVALFAVAHRIGRLGQLRFFAKKSLLFFPVLGLACYFHNFVFLARNWLKDERKIRGTFAGMMQWRQFWMCLFPEGTRINAAKLRESQAFAKERGMLPLQHVLQPRVKGLCASLAALHGQVRGARLLPARLRLTAFDPLLGSWTAWWT